MIAGLVFAVLYGVALRIYTVLRAQRDSIRWHGRALFLSTLAGGAAFYLAQQIRAPHAPTARDAAAFAILCLGASAIPVILELGTVIPARLARGATLRVPQSPGEGPPSVSPSAARRDAEPPAAGDDGA